MQNKNQLRFEDKWPYMESIILKILTQEAVTKSEWQELFYDVHSVCLWDDKGATKLYDHLQEDIVQFIKQAQARVLAHRQEEALLKAYITEWRKFFSQCNYLPTPFKQLEITLQGKQTAGGCVQSSGYKKREPAESIVRKLMLDSWNESIFSDIKHRLQESAMKLVRAERNGEAFDSQLVIGELGKQKFLYFLFLLLLLA